jgi:hypothetical protein
MPGLYEFLVFFFNTLLHNPDSGAKKVKVKCTDE